MSPEDLEELFAPMGRVSCKRMFGGHGIYIGTACFAIASRGQVWIKADAAMEAALEAEGAQPFSMETADGTVKTMRAFWTLPEAAFDDPDVLRRWCDPALAAAQKSAADKAARLQKIRQKAAD